MADRRFAVAGRRLVLNCARQTGKSTTAATLALHRALYYPGSLILLVSPSQRQSTELFRKIAALLDHLPEAMDSAPKHPQRSSSPLSKHPERSSSPLPKHPERSSSPLPKHPERSVAESKDAAVYLPRPALLEDNRLSCVFANRSRIVSLPSSEATIRGFSGASLIIEDEASRVPDDLYRAIRPMLATSNGRIILMSTPFGKRGHFSDVWHGLIPGLASPVSPEPSILSGVSAATTHPSTLSGVSAKNAHPSILSGASSNSSILSGASSNSSILSGASSNSSILSGVSAANAVEGRGPSPETWTRITVPAAHCPRITPQFLAEEQATLGAWWYAQEYDCQFLDAISSAFTWNMINAALAERVETWDL